MVGIKKSIYSFVSRCAPVVVRQRCQVRVVYMIGDTLGKEGKGVPAGRRETNADDEKHLYYSRDAVMRGDAF